MNYLGVLHLHSNYSYDAKLSLAELREILRARGLSFALMTEHTDELTEERARAFVRECEALSDDSFVFIPGFEVSYKDTHILMPGSRMFLTNHASEEEVVAWRKESALAILAHPHRNGYRTSHIPEGVLDGIEVWNAQYDGKRFPRNGGRELYKKLRSENPSLLAFAGWDFHREAHAGGPVLVIELPSFSEASILEALKKGAYTLDSDAVSLGSDGRLLAGDALAVSLSSSATVFLIRLFKVVNRVLAWSNLRLPKSLTAFVRKRI